MQATANNNDETRCINQGNSRHQKTTQTEGPWTEDGPGQLFIVLDDQALFFAEEFLGRRREEGKKGGGGGGRNAEMNI